MKKAIAHFSAQKINTGLLILRIGTGLILGFAGLTKLMNLQMTIGYFGSMGLAPFWAYAVAILEFLGGVLILVGGLGKYAAATLSVIMLVATILVAQQDPMMAMNPAAIFFATLALTFTGTGKYSVKSWC